MLCDDSLTNGFGMETTSNPNALFPMKVSDTETLLFHPREFSPYLYRGQNEYFDICNPSLWREMTKDEEIIGNLQKLTFINAIKRHPNIRVFEMLNILSGYESFKPYKLRIDYEAIAQHYEFKTNHLDFTKDKDVAMFFMTCKYDNNLKKYTPITDNSEGVLYKYDFALDITKKANPINPIGYQPFSRPDKQKAFSIIFNENINFNSFKYVTKEKIRITKKLSEKYFNMFEGGKKLFPQDEISEIAYEIQNNKYISFDILKEYSLKHDITIEKIINIIKNNNLSITKNNYGFNIHNEKSYIEHRNKMLNELQNRIVVRGVWQ